MRSVATVPAVATVESFRFCDQRAQYRNASRARHDEIQPQTRVVSGIVALVTTPLRSLVTRADSLQSKLPARLTPVTHLALGELHRLSVRIGLTI